MERYIDLRASTPCDLSLAEIITSGGLLKYKNVYIKMVNLLNQTFL